LEGLTEAVTDFQGVAQAGEVNTVAVLHTPLVSAAAVTQNARRTAADKRSRSLFEGQEPSFPRRPEGVASQAAVTFHNTVTGNNHRHRVIMQRIANRPRCPRAAKALGEPLVGAHLAIRNGGGRRQDLALEGRTDV